MKDIVCKNCIWEIDGCNTENCNCPKKICGKDCKHFWNEEPYYDFVEDWGCNVMIYDEWKEFYDKYCDDATKCKRFEEGTREGLSRFLDD